MRRSPRERSISALSILLAMVPFAFALIRAVSTGSDFRYLWVAIASFLGGTAVMAVGKSRYGVLTLSAVTLVIATLFAGAAGLLLVTKATPAVWVVAVSFGLCNAGGCALDALSRARTS